MRSGWGRQLGRRFGAMVLVTGVIACGGGGGASDPDDDIIGPGDGDPPSATRAGTVWLLNETPFEIQSAYLHSGEDGERIVGVGVASGEQGQISAGELVAGSQVEFDLVLQVPVSQGLRVRRKALVTVDGDMRVVAELSDASDFFSLRIGIEPAPAEDG